MENIIYGDIDPNMNKGLEDELLGSEYLWTGDENLYIKIDIIKNKWVRLVKHNNLYKYKAYVTKVVDGDTFYATVDLGFNIKADLKFRLEGIDTAEIFRPKNISEKSHGLEAKYFVNDLIFNKWVTIETFKTGKYGRWIAQVTTDSGLNLTEELINNGFRKRDKY